MVKCSFSDMSCPIAKALDVIGEWWTMLIIRDFVIFGGQRGFEDLRDSLGISRNILTERLKRLNDEGLVEKVPQVAGGKRMKYQITEKGQDLVPILLAMKQWGERWYADHEHKHVDFVDSRDSKPVRTVAVQSQDGRTLQYGDIVPVASSPEAQAYYDARMS